MISYFGFNFNRKSSYSNFVFSKYLLSFLSPLSTRFCEFELVRFFAPNIMILTLNYPQMAVQGVNDMIEHFGFYIYQVNGEQRALKYRYHDLGRISDLNRLIDHWIWCGFTQVDQIYYYIFLGNLGKAALNPLSD